MIRAKLMRDAQAARGAVIPFPKACAPAGIGRAPLSAKERLLLEEARWWLVKSRLTARAVVDEACFLLANGMPHDACAYGTAFFRLLGIHAKRRVHFHAAGIETVTVDERWFLQLLDAAFNEDGERLGILLGWRLARSAERRASFLIGELAEILTKRDLEDGEIVVI